MFGFAKPEKLGRLCEPKRSICAGVTQTVGYWLTDSQSMAASLCS